MAKDKIKIISKIKGWIPGRKLYVESVYVDSKPAFLVKNTETGKMSVASEIMIGEIIKIRPLWKKECGYDPYEFTLDEVDAMSSSVISTEEIMDDVLQVVRKYLAVDERDQILITGDVLITYSMEWVDTLHFVFFVGETESGKTTGLYLGKELNYRCLLSASLSAANIYNALGTDEEGSGTICEDEAQDIGKDKEKLKIYKAAYYRGSIIPKVNMLSGIREQFFFKPYGGKWLAGERVPYDKGFRERIVCVHMIGRNPARNLKRATPDERKHLKNIRNRLLIWKIQNIGKEFFRIDSGLTGRDQEMWEDFLSIFHGTKFEPQARKTAKFYLKQRRDSIIESLEAKIFRILKPLLEQSMEIESKTIWYEVTHSDELPGDLDDRTRKTFYLDEDDRNLTPNFLADIIQFKFLAKKKVRYEMISGKKKKITSYVFDESVVKLLSVKYHTDYPL